MYRPNPSGAPLPPPYTCVFSTVTSKLIGSRKSLAAPGMIARIGLLARVLPHVHLQVRELVVALVAALILANERLIRLVVLLRRRRTPSAAAAPARFPGRRNVIRRRDGGNGGGRIRGDGRYHVATHRRRHHSVGKHGAHGRQGAPGTRDVFFEGHRRVGRTNVERLLVVGEGHVDR